MPKMEHRGPQRVVGEHSGVNIRSTHSARRQKPFAYLLVPLSCWSVADLAALAVFAGGAVQEVIQGRADPVAL